eukprot:gene23247-biopygen23816
MCKGCARSARLRRAVNGAGHGGAPGARSIRRPPVAYPRARGGPWGKTNSSGIKGNTGGYEFLSACMTQQSTALRGTARNSTAQHGAVTNRDRALHGAARYSTAQHGTPRGNPSQLIRPDVSGATVFSALSAFSTRTSSAFSRRLLEDGNDRGSVPAAVKRQRPHRFFFNSCVQHPRCSIHAAASTAGAASSRVAVDVSMPARRQGAQRRIHGVAGHRPREATAPARRAAPGARRTRVGALLPPRSSACRGHQGWHTHEFHVFLGGVNVH